MTKPNLMLCLFVTCTFLLHQLMHLPFCPPPILRSYSVLRLRLRLSRIPRKLLLCLAVPMHDQFIEEAPRLALSPAIFLGFGEFFLEVLLGFFVGFVVGVVVG